jgi:hypothetical protein
VEFNNLGFQTQSQLMGSAPQSLTVAGLPAVAAEAEESQATSFPEARLMVQLSSTPTDPGLFVEAPTVAAARTIAEAVVPRLASVD